MFSHKEPTVIGTKAVYVCPGVQEFLGELSLLANHIIVWSSMMRKSVEPIAGFLFQNTREPYVILGQEQCRKVERFRGKFVTEGGNPFKVLLLKVLGEHLFLDPGDPSSFSKDDTILIDDSPFKSVLNENGNAVFLPG